MQIHQNNIGGRRTRLQTYCPYVIMYIKFPDGDVYFIERV